MGGSLLPRLAPGTLSLWSLCLHRQGASSRGCPPLVPLRPTEPLDLGPDNPGRSPRGIPHGRTSAKILFPSKVKRTGSRGLVVRRSLWGPLGPTAAAGRRGPCSGQMGCQHSSSPPRGGVFPSTAPGPAPGASEQRKLQPAPSSQHRSPW